MFFLLYAAFWAVGITAMVETHGTNQHIAVGAFVAAHLIYMLIWSVFSTDNNVKIR